MSDFESNYNSLKDKGYSDSRIAKSLFIGLSTLKRRKKKYGIKTVKIPMPNNQGLTQNQLERAESLGIKRDVVLRRVRAYGWDIETAISTPSIPLNKRRYSSGFSRI